MKDETQLSERAHRFFTKRGKNPTRASISGNGADFPWAIRASDSSATNYI